LTPHTEVEHTNYWNTIATTIYIYIFIAMTDIVSYKKNKRKIDRCKDGGLFLKDILMT